MAARRIERHRCSLSPRTTCARRRLQLEHLANALSAERACVLPLDVTDGASLVAAEAELIKTWSGYDLVVMLAGDYVPQRVQDFDLARAQSIVATNLGGVCNTLNVVLPRLLAGDRLTRFDVVSLGVGGLLEEIHERPMKRES